MLNNILSNMQLRQKRRAAHRLGHQGLQAMGKNDLDTAERYLNAALAAFGNLGDRAEEAATHTHLATLNQQRGDIDEAEEHLRVAIAQFEQVGDMDGGATAQSGLGVVALGRDEFEDAERHFREALKLYKKAENAEGVAHSHGAAGIALLGQKNYEASVAALEKSVEMFDELNQQHGLAPMLSNLAEAHFEAGNRDEALERWDHAQEIYRTLGLHDAVDHIQERIDATSANGKPGTSSE